MLQSERDALAIVIDKQITSRVAALTVDIARMVADAVAALPAPAAGVDGRDADPAVIARMVADAVAALPAPAAGADGVGVAGAVIDRSGALILTLSNGETKSLGRVIGDDGNDGLGFDDIEVIYDGHRSFTLQFVRGEKVKSATFALPVVIDCGVWTDADYSPGDGVTWRGSFWICQRETRSKPDESSTDWRLAVKRGRDGKDMRS